MKYNLSIHESCREAYGESLVELGRENPDLMVLDADLSSSTKTNKFAKEFPDRFLNVGIAEQNMIDIAAGLALSGKTPFVSTYAIFGCGRAWEQIRNTIALNKLNVNLVFTHSGLTLGGDGATHQMLEDIALMRVLPNMQVIVPADATETRAVIKFIAETDGPSYVRLPRSESVVLFEESDYTFNPNEYTVLADGSDITLFTMGCMIEESLKAADELKQEGVSVKVVNVHTIKPLAKKSILKLAKDTGIVVSVEGHNVIGGLGSAIAEVLIEKYPIPMKLIGVNDQFGESGNVEELYVKYGLNSTNIIKEIKEMIKLR